MLIRKMLFSFLTMLSSSVFVLAGQSDTCNFAITTTPSTQVGGRYITASGTLNVLCVYVQFPDDNWLPSSSWWLKGQPPTYMNSTVDSVWSSTPTAGGITDFFNQMSFNTLQDYWQISVSNHSIVGNGI